MNGHDVARRLQGRKPSTLVAVSVAFLAGVLVAALVVPERDEVVGAGPIATAGGDGAESAVPTGADGGRVDGSTRPGGGSGSQSGGGTGGTAAPGAGSGSGGGGGGGGEPGASGGATAPGVTANEITIGFGLPDLSVIAALGPGYDQGNPRQHIEGILAQLRAEGRLPVHGRDIKPIFSSYNILSADEQRATCEAFGNDATVFAVVAVHDFGEGNECTAREFGIPTFTSDGSSDAVHARSAPNLFTMQMTTDRLLRNFVQWAHRDGLLRGRRIGVYYPSDTPESAKVVEDNVIAPIRKLGHTIEVTVQTSEPATGGPTDAVAVQRFSSKRVDTAILIVSAVAKTNFFNHAQTQGYRPRYLENDTGFSTTDTATGTYPPEHFDGTQAFTGMRFGESNSGVAEPPEATWCRAAIKRQTGNDIPRKGRDAEYIASNQACDEILTVLTGLEQAGPNLTRARFIAGVETIRNRRAGIHSNLTFTPQRHDGGGTWRRISWSKGCRCWTVRSRMAPLLVD